MNSIRLHSIIVPGAVLLALSGCQTAGTKVNTEFDAQAKFAEAKTFIVAPMPKSIPGVDPGMILRVGPAAQEAAAASLLEKGYTEVEDAAKADIAVLVHGKAVPKTDITDWGFEPYYGDLGWHAGYPYGAWGGSRVSVDQYNEGTLIVEVYDVPSKKMVWVGWITGRTTKDTSKQASRVSLGVSEILAQYPEVGMMPPAPPAKPER